MIMLLWRNDRTFYQIVHTQASFHVLTRISHMDEWVIHGEIETLAYIRDKTHEIYILSGLKFPWLLV